MLYEFTKSDLENGMIIEIVTGKRYLVLGDILIGEDSWIELKDYDDNLNNYHEKLRIDYVYIIKKGGILKRIFRTEKLELIWKRSKKVDWSKVPKESKVIVRNSEDEEWKNRYFYSYNTVDNSYKVTRIKRDFFTGYEPTGVCYKYCKLVSKENSENMEVI